MIIVHKFGGTSVGSAERIAAVADIVQNASLKARGSVVVASAMSKVTNALIAGAWAAAEGNTLRYQEIIDQLLERHLNTAETLLPRHVDLRAWLSNHFANLNRLYESIAVLGELTPRGLDHVSAFGEQASVRILAAVLEYRGVRAQAISATQVVVTDDAFGAAIPLMAQTRERLQHHIRPLLDEGIVPVITGFIGATAQGITTTLGRGGSDYTAAIVGAGLDADEVWIWSDVNGILTADPNLVPEARTLRELSYAEAAELAYYGAAVLHPKTIRPVIERKVPLRILNSFAPDDPGTLITETPCVNRACLPAIISTPGLSQIVLGFRDDVWSLQHVARTLENLDKASVDVLMFSQSFSEHRLNLVVGQQEQKHCIRVIEQLFAEQLTGGLCSVTAEDAVATVSVVGMPGAVEPGIVSRAFVALGTLGTRVIAVAQAGTEFSVSFCIPEAEVTETVRYLHKQFNL